jgi:hypothetical protein
MPSSSGKCHQYTETRDTLIHTNIYSEYKSIWHNVCFSEFSNHLHHSAGLVKKKRKYLNNIKIHAYRAYGID